MSVMPKPASKNAHLLPISQAGFSCGCLSAAKVLVDRALNQWLLEERAGVERHNYFAESPSQVVHPKVHILVHFDVGILLL